jgi:translation initiation factor 3 subunit I
MIPILTFVGDCVVMCESRDVESGKEILKVQDHKKPINSLQFSKDQTMIITASSDHTAKLYDAKTLQLLKTFNSDRPLNAAAISPIMNHVLVGGGQEAMNVTATSAKVGHFEADFFHSVYCEYLGSVKGHFGPINTLAFNPTGKSYASGAEDGYIRLQHFDKEYFKSSQQN